jgi:hypothetical protein
MTCGASAVVVQVAAAKPSNFVSVNSIQRFPGARSSTALEYDYCAKDTQELDVRDLDVQEFNMQKFDEIVSHGDGSSGLAGQTREAIALIAESLFGKSPVERCSACRAEARKASEGWWER